MEKLSRDSPGREVMFEYPLVSIASIGWIPYYRSLAEFPPGPARTAIMSRSWWKRRGYDLLFYSGNNMPVGSLFSGSGERPFADYLEKKDYRGALALWDVRLHVPAHGEPFIDANHLEDEEEVGYTAVRPLPIKIKRFALFTQGKHKEYGRTDRLSSEPTENGIKFTHNITFRVGWKANLGAKAFFRRDIPYVWIRLVYSVDFGGPIFTAIDKCRLGIGVAATYVPSQQYWDNAFSGAADMLRVHPPPPYPNTHSMENNDLSRLEDVFASRNDVAQQFFNYDVDYRWDTDGNKWQRVRTATRGLP
jgi:hypothetical protein